LSQVPQASEELLLSYQFISVISTISRMDTEHTDSFVDMENPAEYIRENTVDEIALCRPWDRFQLSIPRGCSGIAKAKDGDVTNLISNYTRRIHVEKFARDKSEIGIKRTEHRAIKNARISGWFLDFFSLSSSSKNILGVT